MAIYIQTSGGDRYFLDAVFNVSYNQTGSPTEYAVESGVSSSDHYNQSQDSVSISGSISKVKFVRRQKGVESTDLGDFEAGLTSLKKSGQFFSVSFSDNLSILRNCLFTSLIMTRSSQTGRYAIDVTMDIVSVVVAAQSEVVETPEPLRQYRDAVVPGEDSSAGSTEYPTKQEESELEKTRNSLGRISGIT